MSYWYANNTEGIIVSSRVRLARNLADLPFPRRMTSDMMKELTERVKKAVEEISVELELSLKFIDMDSVPENEIRAMVERHIISIEFAQNRKGRSIALSQDESVSIMIGEEDHLRIQVLKGGMSLDEVYSLADRIDTALGERLSFAYDSELGYLTECPTNIGTGLRASVMLHLPLTEDSNDINSIAEAISKIGFTVRGMYGEGSKSKASLYQISNQITLGISEKSAIENLKVITGQIAEREENARKSVDRLNLEDVIYRAYGIAKYARRMSSEEFMQIASKIKLGKDMGILNVEKVNPIELLILSGAGMIQSKYGEMSPNERDESRAEMIRKYLG